MTADFSQTEGKVLLFSKKKKKTNSMSLDACKMIEYCNESTKTKPMYPKQTKMTADFQQNEGIVFLLR